MKEIILLLTLSFLSLNGFSQNQYISGTLKNDKLGEVMPFCKLTLKQDTIISAFAVSDMNGYFEIPAISGNYLLVIKFIGFKTDSLEVEVNDKNEVILINILVQSL